MPMKINRQELKRVLPLLVLVLGPFLVLLATCSWLHGMPLHWLIVGADKNEAFRMFYSATNANGEALKEGEFTDILIFAGPCVYDQVIENVKKPGEKMRGYQILFLGYAGVSKAVPTLEHLLIDQNEDEYIRYDALRALRIVDTERAEFLAKSIATGNQLNRGFIDFLQENPREERRYLLDVLFSTE